MKTLLWLCAPAGLLLASPIPPPATALDLPQPSVPRLDYAYLDCSDVGCTEVIAPPEAPQVAAPTPAWHPSSAGGTLRILISIPQQRAYVFRGGELLATSQVSTGKRGHPTPTGTFPILQKQVTHHSNLYDNAPMPYMQRLTESGVALHAGHVPGYPASHGCIRLPWSFAKKLYGLTGYGTHVTVTRARPKSPKQALTLAYSAASAGGSNASIVRQSIPLG